MGMGIKRLGRYDEKYGSPARTRTRDRLINSQLLYQLSYWGTVNFKRGVW